MAFNVKIINGKAPSGGVGGVSDKDLANFGVNFLTQGINSSGHLAVTQQDTPSMNVEIASGIAYIFNPAGDNVYCVENDDTAVEAVSSNASGNDRIDAVVLKIDLSVTPDNTASNVASIQIVEGTPAASPSAPSDSDIQTAVGAGNPFIRLSDVSVDNGASSITDADIADMREPVEFKLFTGRLRFNPDTSKLQFAHDGSSFKDFGSGTVTPTFTVIGTLTTGTNKTPLLIAPFALTIKKAFARVKTAPTGASIIIDINKNGSSIWTSTPANRLTIAASASSGNQANFDTTSLAEGDYLTIDIDQVGSSVAGEDLTVELFCEGA